MWQKHVTVNKEEVIEFMPQEKTQLRRPRRRWEDNINMDLQKVGCGVWIELSLGRDSWWALVTAVMNLRVP